MDPRGPLASGAAATHPLPRTHTHTHTSAARTKNPRGSQGKHGRSPSTVCTQLLSWYDKMERSTRVLRPMTNLVLVRFPPALQSTIDPRVSDLEKTVLEPELIGPKIGSSRDPKRRLLLSISGRRLYMEKDPNNCIRLWSKATTTTMTTTSTLKSFPGE